MVAMPPKHYDPSRPTFYLDNSTLCSAWKAHRHEKDAAKYAAYSALVPWIERVAQEANLCLSHAHLLELESWADTATARGMVEWYEELPVVWVRDPEAVDDLEDRYWTMVAAGVPPKKVADKPFAPSLISSFFAPSREIVSRLLSARKPLVALFDAKLPGLDQRRGRFIANILGVAELHRQWAKAGWTQPQVQARLEQNLRVALRKRAYDTNARLAAERDPAYVNKACTDGAVQDLLVDLYERDARTMPMFRATRLFIRGSVDLAGHGEVVNGRPSNKLSGALSGLLFDYWHLVGAAYCDVFTCDRTVSDWLGDSRVTLGLRPQMAVRGHPGAAEGFVRDLTATWPEATNLKRSPASEKGDAKASP